MDAWRYDNPKRLAGVHRTLAFAFAHNAPGLATGYTVYTPTVGDILHDAWLVISVPWNGTTPKGDAGSFVITSQGWWGAPWGPVDMTEPDQPQNSGLLGQNFGPDKFMTPAGLSALQSLYAAAAWSGLYGSYRIVPAKFATADPIKVVVSQDGTPTGADPGASQGAAILYLEVSTPARG